MNYILDSENKKQGGSKNTENMESPELSGGKAQQESRTKDERHPQEGTCLNAQKTGNEEKFLNTSRKRKEKSLDQRGMAPVLTLE